MVVVALLLFLLLPLATRVSGPVAETSSPREFVLDVSADVMGTPVAVLANGQGESILVASQGEAAVGTLTEVTEDGSRELVTLTSSIDKVAVTSSAVWVSTVRPGGDIELVSLDPTTFETKVSLPGLGGSIVAASGHLFAEEESPSRTSIVSIDPESGQTRAVVEIPAVVSVLLVDDGLVYALPLEGTTIRVFDLELRPVGSLTPSGDWTSLAVVQGGSLTALVGVGFEAQLQHFEGLGGQPLWTVDGLVGRPIGWSGGALITLDERGVVKARDLSSGELLAELILPVPAGGGFLFPTAVAVDGGVWIVTDEGDVTRLQLV